MINSGLMEQMCIFRRTKDLNMISSSFICLSTTIFIYVWLSKRLFMMMNVYSFITYYREG